MTTMLALICGSSAMTAAQSTDAGTEYAYYESVLLIEDDLQNGEEKDADEASTTAVQLMQPRDENGMPALILIPGGGLSSAIYRQTIDGRVGWAEQFVTAGFRVYLTKPSGRLSADKLRWESTDVWPLWGIGEVFPRRYENSQFPDKSADTLSPLLRLKVQPLSVTQLARLLDTTGDAIVIAHSAGGRLMFHPSILAHPNVRGTVAIETLKCPVDGERISKSYAPGQRWFVGLWGDRLDRGRPSMRTRFNSCEEMTEALQASGVSARNIQIPRDLGVSGNSHLLMQDRNSGDLGKLLLREIFAREARRPN